MANAKDIVAGVGTRYGVVFPLDANGIPNAGTSSATPTQGTLVHGIKNVTVNDPEPRRINHVGNDGVLAADSLPPTEVGSFSFEAGVTNLNLDDTLENTKIRTLGTIRMRAGNSDKRGNEVQVLAMFYRQALDNDPASATFGKLRQWHANLYPSVRISPQSQGFSDAETNKVYNATPTPVKQTPWGETIDDADWGAVRAEYIETIWNYQPRINIHRGNNTLTSFALSHPPASSADLVVLSAATGAALTPSSINTSTTNPSFTLGSAPAVDVIVLSLIGTDEPGSS